MGPWTTKTTEKATSALAIALAIVLVGPAAAASLTPERIQDELQQFVRDRLPDSVGEVAVDGINVADPLAMPEGELVLRFRPRPGEDFIGRTMLSMDVMHGPAVVDTRSLSFRVTGTVDVWTIAAPVGRGKRVDESSLTVDQRDLDSLAVDAVLVGEDIGVADASRDLAVGTVLCRSMLRRQPDIPRGAPVLVELHSGPLTVTCYGTAMGNGFVGEALRARCDETGASVTGVLDFEGRVVMSLPRMIRVGGGAR